MGHVDFVLATARLIEGGRVVKSKFGTAGPYRVAVSDGEGPYAVITWKGLVLRFSTAVQTAKCWHDLNMRYIGSSAHGW